MRNQPATGHSKRRYSRPGLTLIELLVVIAILGLLAALLMPATRGTRETARRLQCGENLRQLSIALHHYHKTYESFPPAVTTNSSGRPLHSWRTQMLPFFDQRSLYELMDLSQPWDAPVNIAPAGTAVLGLRCPSAQLTKEQTTYAGIVGPHACLLPSDYRRIKDITDGAARTLMAVDVAGQAAIPWSAPQDGGGDFFLTCDSGTDFQHPSAVQALFADGWVKLFSVELDDAVRQALITADGGETIGEF
jgi:prepilin-type N-terminal cleavage/methylation domain-containing protein